MEDHLLREQLCQAARQLWSRGLIVGDGGLISAEQHRRRYLVTPPGRRRSDLSQNELTMIDLGGVEIDGPRVLDPALWLPHRAAYQARGSAVVAGQAPGDAARGASATGTSRLATTAVSATILATPPQVLALLRLRPQAAALSLNGVAPLPVADPADESALKNLLAGHNALMLRGMGLLCLGADLASALNAVERIEHAATIELPCGPPT